MQLESVRWLMWPNRMHISRQCHNAFPLCDPAGLDIEEPKEKIIQEREQVSPQFATV